MTPEQQDNLRKLANYLKALPKDYTHFDMQWLLANESMPTFAPFGVLSSISDVAGLLQQCGTVACALGHAPAAGIATNGYKTWASYSTHALGVSTTSPAWAWMFSENWSQSDNTPAGAAARIEHYLEHGVPEEFITLDRDDDAMAFDPDFYRSPV